MNFHTRQWTLKPSTICGLGLVLVGLTVAVGAAWAFVPSVNLDGITWVRASAESWSGSSQANPAGAALDLTGAFGASVDTTNPAGVSGHIGQLDPIDPLNPPGSLAKNWDSYE